MKKTLLLAGAFLIASLTFGQSVDPVPAGTIVIGGDSNLGLDFGTKKHDGDKIGDYSNFNISPTVAYFVAPNLALGLSPELATGSYKDKASGVKTTTTAFSGALFLRYHFPQQGWTPWVHGQFGFGNEKEKTGGVEFKDDFIQYGIYGGFDLPIANTGAAFTTQIGYTGTDYDKSKIYQGGFGINVGVLVAIGPKSAN